MEDPCCGVCGESVGDGDSLTECPSCHRHCCAGCCAGVGTLCFECEDDDESSDADLAIEP